MLRTNVQVRLAQHFFRRLFDNDVFDSDGETVTTVVRALSTVAAPGLIFAFYLQISYPQRTTWGRIEDQYFFVLFSFVAMAGVAIFEWEMLFPERLDFLVLASLPLRPRQLLLGKALALGGFMGLFLVASNLFGAFMLPAVSKGAFWRMVWAQGVATGLAGVFAVSGVVGLGAALLCVLPPALFRRVLWPFQAFGTATLGLLMIAYARFGDGTASVLEHPGVAVQCLPPIWFLGMYQRLLHGASAQAFAQQAAHRAWLAVGISVATAALLYPMAWVRMQQMAIQGEATRALRPVRWWANLLAHLISKPTERAIFSFVGKTMPEQPVPGIPRDLLWSWAGTGSLVFCWNCRSRQRTISRAVELWIARGATSLAVLGGCGIAFHFRRAAEPARTLDLSRGRGGRAGLRPSDTALGHRDWLAAYCLDGTRLRLPSLGMAPTVGARRVGNLLLRGVGRELFRGSKGCTLYQAAVTR